MHRPPARFNRELRNEEKGSGCEVAACTDLQQVGACFNLNASLKWLNEVSEKLKNTSYVRKECEYIFTKDNETTSLQEKPIWCQILSHVKMCKQLLWQ